MIIFNLVIAIISVLLLMSAVKPVVKKSGSASAAILSKDSTTVVRGAAILFIALHHFSQYFDSLGFLQGIFQQCGYAFTAVFFFLSGYGCFFSLKKYAKLNNGEKLKQTALWCFSHSLRIYLDFIIIHIIDCLLLYLLNVQLEEQLTLASAIKGALTITLPTWVCWYPKIQILCYIILSIAFIISDKKKSWITFFALTAYVGIAVVMRLPSMWFSSVLCFPIGCLFAEYIPKLRLDRKRLTLLLIAATIPFCVLFYTQIHWHQSILRTASTLFIPFIITSVTGLFALESKVLAAVGKMSFEIYLIHIAVLRILVCFEVQSNIAITVLIASSLLIGWLLHKFVTHIMDNTVLKSSRKPAVK